MKFTLKEVVSFLKTIECFNPDHSKPELKNENMSSADWARLFEFFEVTQGDFFQLYLRVFEIELFLAEVKRTYFINSERDLYFKTLSRFNAFPDKVTLEEARISIIEYFCRRISKIPLRFIADDSLGRCVKLSEWVNHNWH